MSPPVATPGQAEIQAVDLQNSRGDRVSILNLGGIIRSWEVAVDDEEPVNIILGYPHLQQYLTDTSYHGALAGRYCNRIANRRFTLDGEEFKLTANDGHHHLHGGPDGFHKRSWAILEQDRQSLLLHLDSNNGDQGYPGNLGMSVCYTLDDEGSLNIDWEATSDADTVVSLTSHGYFNLAGCGDILDQQLRIPAAAYTPVDEALIPTGKIESVAGTALDLRVFTRLGDILNSKDPAIQSTGGLDHNWAGGDAGKMKLRAELFSAHTGLLLAVHSTLPGLQCYTGNHLQAGGYHGSHEGICLEPQYYPDSPNQTQFPSPILRAGETMRHRISYRISHSAIEQQGTAL